MHLVSNASWKLTFRLRHVVNRSSLYIGLALLWLLIVAAPASAQTQRFYAMLAPVKGAGSGRAEFTYFNSTNQLTFRMVYDYLSGPPTAATIQALSPNGQARGTLSTFQSLQSPIAGTDTLTQAEERLLLNGYLMIVIHTKLFPGGEVQGRVLPNK